MEAVGAEVVGESCVGERLVRNLAGVERTGKGLRGEG